MWAAWTSINTLAPAPQTTVNKLIVSHATAQVTQHFTIPYNKSNPSILALHQHEFSNAIVEDDGSFNIDWTDSSKGCFSVDAGKALLTILNQTRAQISSPQLLLSGVTMTRLICRIDLIRWQHWYNVWSTADLANRDTNANQRGSNGYG